LRIPFLLSETLTPTQKRQLLSVIFGQNLSLVEGTATLLIVEAICFYRTGSFVFIDIALAAFLVLVLRLTISAWYWCSSASSQISNHSCPNVWTRRFTIGAAATAFLWGLTDFCTISGFEDEGIKLFVLLVRKRQADPIW
jgi:hypothetical protein